MAPGLLDELPSHSVSQKGSKGTSYPEPLKLSGALEKFAFEESTPVIGREINANIVDDLLNAENADELLRDLAITSEYPCVLNNGSLISAILTLTPVSQRGVVFFRKQDNLTNDLQKQLIHRLGQLTGKPSDSTLHIHPILNGTNEFGNDAEISTISSVQRKKLFKHNFQENKRKYDSAQWHSDIQFENVPADYTSLRLTQLPSTGGDTLWASGYELFDRFSKPYQKFFESLTATFAGTGFIEACKRNPEEVKLYTGARGSNQNVGGELTTVHPVVRTNPVTGWKSIYALGPFPTRINELHQDESEELLKKFKSFLIENHDLQVRFKWRNENDLGQSAR